MTSIPIKLTNDYFFRILMQNDEYVLKSLIAALLMIPEESIVSLKIENPIKIGDLV